MGFLRFQLDFGFFPWHFRNSQEFSENSADSQFRIPRNSQEFGIDLLIIRITLNSGFILMGRHNCSQLQHQRLLLMRFLPKHCGFCTNQITSPGRVRCAGTKHCTPTCRRRTPGLIVTLEISPFLSPKIGNCNRRECCRKNASIFAFVSISCTADHVCTTSL